MASLLLSLSDSTTNLVVGSELDAPSEETETLFQKDDSSELKTLIERDGHLTEHELRKALANERRHSDQLREELNLMKARMNDTKSLMNELLRPITRWNDRSLNIDEYNEFKSLKSKLSSQIEQLQIRIETVSKKVEQNVSWIHNERDSYFHKVSILLRNDFRTYCGIDTYERCGYFLDKYLNRMVFDYCYWLAYPEGNHILRGHTNLLRSLVVSDDGRFLYSGSRDNTIIAWDLLNNTQIKRWTAHEDYVVCLAYYEGMLVSSCKDGTIRIWNAHSLECVRTLKGHSDAIPNINLNSDGTRIVSASYDHTVREWSVETGECLRVYLGHTDDVTSCHFVGDVIVSGCKDRSIKVWNPETLKSDRTITKGITSDVSDLRFNCDQTLLACISFRSSITIYSWPEMEVVNNLKKNSLRCCFHPNKPTLLAFPDRILYEVWVYDVVTGRSIHCFKGHSGKIPRLRFTPDGHRLITGSDDQSVRVWDASFLLDYHSDDQ